MGWVGERSVPMTLADGYSSAKSIAQIPVPVPRSSTFWLDVSLDSDNYSAAAAPEDFCLLAQDGASRPEGECASGVYKSVQIQLIRKGIRTLYPVAHFVNRHLGPYMNISKVEEIC